MVVYSRSPLQAPVYVPSDPQMVPLILGLTFGATTGDLIGIARPTMSR